MSMNVYAGCFRNVAAQPSSNSHLEKLFKSFICGEYRSRTDDLLNANQAL